MITEISWKEILPIWQNKLWPGRTSPIEPNSAMKFKGGYDMRNMETTPTFIAYKKNNLILGVFGGHTCSEDDYRVRGFWVDPDHRNQGIGTQLLAAMVEQGLVEGCSMVWGYPKPTSWSIFQKQNFKLASEWEEGELGSKNAYVSLSFKT
jgi:GNAT superfamily N-acetyltransferase